MGRSRGYGVYGVRSTVTVTPGEQFKGTELGWHLDVRARKDESVTVEVEWYKLTERRVRTHPDGSREETVRVIERP